MYWPSWVLYGAYKPTSQGSDISRRAAAVCWLDCIQALGIEMETFKRKARVGKVSIQSL